MSYLPLRDTFPDVPPDVAAAILGLSIAIDENSAEEHADDLYGKGCCSKEREKLKLMHQADSYETILWLYKLGYLDNKSFGC